MTKLTSIEEAKMVLDHTVFNPNRAPEQLSIMEAELREILGFENGNPAMSELLIRFLNEVRLTKNISAGSLLQVLPDVCLDAYQDLTRISGLISAERRYKVLPLEIVESVMEGKRIVEG